MKDSSAEKIKFTAYCCGMPMKSKREGNRIHFSCATGKHGRWFTISEDSSQESTCSCYSGEGELQTADLCAMRLYSCKMCGARYTVFVDGIKIETEVVGVNADDVARVGRESISAMWDRLGGPPDRSRGALFHREVKLFVDQIKGDTVIGQKIQGDKIDVSGHGSIGKSDRDARINIASKKERKESKWIRPIIIAVIGSVLAAIIIYLMKTYSIIFGA